MVVKIPALPPKGLRAREVPLKDTAHGAFAHGGPHAVAVKSHACCHGPQGAAEREEQHQTLKDIGVDQSRLSAAMRVEPNEQQRDGCGDGEGDTERRGDEGVEHQAGDIKAGGGTGQFAEKKKNGTDAACFRTETTREVAVNAGEPQTIINRQEDERHNDVAHDKTGAHLQIGHPGGGCPRGNTHQRNARDAAGNHAESHHGPGGGTGGTVESGIAGATVTTFGETREENEQGKIDREADEHEKHDAQL